MSSTLDRERVAGALWGGAVGDMVGRMNEAKPHHSRQPVTAFDPARADISDDTQLTVLVAENLIAGSGRIDPEHLAAQLVDWLPVGTGVGSATRHAVHRLTDGEPWWSAGEPSGGNGAAMRVAPIGIVHHSSPEDRWFDTVLCTMPTHRDPTAIAASLAMAAATSYCVTIDPGRFDVPDLLATAIEAARAAPALPLAPRDPREPVDLTFVEAVGRLHDRMDLSGEDYFERSYSGAFALESVPAALWAACRMHDDPAAAITVCAELARDADTVAAMAGTLVGALRGVSALPADWVGAAPRPGAERLERATEGLTVLANRGRRSW